MIKRNTSQICLWVGMVLMLAVSARASPGTWFQTGDLNFGRYGHTATLLPNGKVLVAGGSRSGLYVVQSEVYDPAAMTWSLTGNLSVARSSHTATLLPNGKVLVAGGEAMPGFFQPFLSQSELYDPATGGWTETGNLNVARSFYTATLLSNGKVLVAGGSLYIPPDPNQWDSGRGTWYYFVQSELYDPANGTWSLTGNLNVARSSHTATLLPNGKVLVAGGMGGLGNSSELYDPATGTWSKTGNLNSVARFGHTATLLPNGKVLVVGGGETGSSPEMYDPATGTWSLTGNLNVARSSTTATLLPNGKVLVAGGAYGTILYQSELYDPATGAWSLTGNLNVARSSHTATLLPNGKVLVAGGRNSSSAIVQSELFRPKTNAMPWLMLLLD